MATVCLSICILKMCGRAAQSRAAVQAASQYLQISETNAEATERKSSESSEASDNYNMSPGMDAFVFRKNSEGRMVVEQKVWGLISKHGTKNAPLLEGMSKHFNGLMFNARSDTLFEKPTFSRLLGQNRSCLIAVDGFFEWKNDPIGGKQPYFVTSSSSNQPQHFLLMPGLWTSVKTGNGDETLDTFTIITTEVCKPLEWLHSRMPICLWDNDLAKKWLDKPTESILRKMEAQAKSTTERMLHWHPVTKEMSSLKYRGPGAMKRISTTKSLKAFFPVKNKNEQPMVQKEEGATKRSQPSTTTSTKQLSSPPSKKARKTGGPLDVFFSPKKWDRFLLD